MHAQAAAALHNMPRQGLLLLPNSMQREMNRLIRSHAAATCAGSGATPVLPLRSPCGQG